MCLATCYSCYRMPQNAFLFHEIAIFRSAKKRRKDIFHPPSLSQVIFATATVVAFVLFCNSRFKFHCYIQRETTPTQKSSRKWRCDFLREKLQRAFNRANQLHWTAQCIPFRRSKKADNHGNQATASNRTSTTKPWCKPPCRAALTGTMATGKVKGAGSVSRLPCSWLLWWTWAYWNCRLRATRPFQPDHVWACWTFDGYQEEYGWGADGDEARVTHVQFSASPLGRCGELDAEFCWKNFLV